MTPQHIDQLKAQCCNPYVVREKVKLSAARIERAAAAKPEEDKDAELASFHAGLVTLLLSFCCFFVAMCAILLY
jgi:hypothetical protein